MKLWIYITGVEIQKKKCRKRRQLQTNSYTCCSIPKTSVTNYNVTQHYLRKWEPVLVLLLRGAAPDVQFIASSLRTWGKVFHPVVFSIGKRVNTAYIHSYYQEQSLTLTFDLRRCRTSMSGPPALPPAVCYWPAVYVNTLLHIRWALRDRLWEDKVGELFCFYGLYWSGFIFMLTGSNNKTALLQFSCVQENFNYLLLSEEIKQSSTPYVCSQ